MKIGWIYKAIQLGWVIAFTTSTLASTKKVSHADHSSQRFKWNAVVGSEFHGFLRTSQYRDNWYGQFDLSLKTQYEWEKWEYRSEIKGYVLNKDVVSSFTPDLPYGFIGTTERLSKKHRIRFGRSSNYWSVSDTFWNQGLYEGRFTWDPLQSQNQGHIGIHYRYRTKNFSLRAMFSPISIPERGMPVKSENGILVSPGPWFIQPVDGTILNGKFLPAFYDLQYPSIADTLFRPGGAIKASLGSRNGFWGSTTYGYLPVNQVDLAARIEVPPQENYVLAEVHPTFHYHHLFTGEAGYRWKTGDLWVSGTREIPIETPVPSQWIRTPLRNTTLLSAGTRVQWMRDLSMGMSFLYVNEDPYVVPLTEQDFNLQLPGRHPYLRAFHIKGAWSAASNLQFNASWLFDTEYSNGVVSLNALWSPPNFRKVNVQVGTDLIRGETNSGWLGQTLGNDRFYGRVSYVF